MFIKQNSITNNSLCPWHKPYVNGKVYSQEEIFPDNICPYLYNTIYPYFLGMLYGASFKYNEFGDCNVCCPAEHGIDVLVCKRQNDGSLFEDVKTNYEFVIYAEVVSVNGMCPSGHTVGQKFLFRTVDKTHFLCPAGVHNIFPFLDLPIPKCINISSLRCPDYAMPIYYSMEGKTNGHD